MNTKPQICLLLLGLLLIKEKVHAGYDCIPECKCKSNDDLLVVDCTGAAKTEIPAAHTSWVYEVHTLILNYNRVVKIQASAFAPYSRLEVLDIKGNGLQFIEKDAFLPLKTKNMTWLDLSSNYLKSKSLDELIHVASTLEYLSLAYNQLGEVPSVIGMMTNLRVLDLSHNSLLSIPESFLPAPLRVANFSYNTIKRYGNSTFANNAALEHLILSDSFASTDVRFEQATFSPLVNMQHLDLSRCFCRRIALDSFATMSRLKTLKLQKSYLSKLPHFRRKVANSSSGMLAGSNLTTTTNTQTDDDGDFVWNNAQLETLDLSQNRRLSFAKADRTPFPPSLRSLDLSADPLKIIDDQLLANLHDLRTLMLDGNRVNAVSKSAFKSTKKLTQLSMAVNNLRSVPLMPASMEKLALPDNRITDLNRIDLGVLVNLTTIDLSRGSISSINGPIFSNMSRLVSLNVSANKLQMLNNETLQISPHTVLKVLDLQKNEIEEIEGSPFMTHDNLKELYIHENRIREIEEHTFKGLTSLVVLDLSVNDIEDISPTALAGLVNLEVLRLNSNQMEILWRNLFGTLGRLHTLTLHDNKLIKIDPQVLPSVTQLSLIHNRLSTVPPLTAPKLQKLILANNNLTIIGENAFSETEKLEYIDMYSNNELVIKDYSPFTKLKNLTYLNIAQCSPSRFVNVPLPALKTLIMYEALDDDLKRPLAEILPSIVDIDLAYNNITTISPTIFANVKHLKSIDLKGNNFDCVCELQPFFDWAVRSKNVIDVVAFEFYMCETPDEFWTVPLMQAIPKLNCTTPAPPTAPPATTTTVPGGGGGAVVNSYEIALLVLSGLIVIVGLLIFIQRRRAFARRSGQQDGNADQNEAMVPGAGAYAGPHCSDCCVPLFKLNLARGSGGMRSQRLTSDEEHRDLMVPSVVTSPMDEPSATAEQL